MVAGGAAPTAAHVPPEVNLGYASDMAEGSGARWTTARNPPKACLGSASRTAVGGDVSFRRARRALREAPCSVKPMEAAKGVLSKGARRVRRGVRLFVKDTAVESGARLTVVVFVRRVFTAEPYFALRMAAGSGVRFQGVREVRGGGRIVVSGMVAVRGVSLVGVGRVHKGVRIFARRMVVGRGVCGVNQGQNMEIIMKMMFVIRLREGRPGCVRLMGLWFRISGSMVVPPWGPWFMKWYLTKT